MNRREWLGLLWVVVWVVVALVGVAVLVDAFSHPGSRRTVQAVLGVALAFLGIWYSGLVDSPSDPNHPWRRFR